MCANVIPFSSQQLEGPDEDDQAKDDQRLQTEVFFLQKKLLLQFNDMLYLVFIHMIGNDLSLFCCEIKCLTFMEVSLKKHIGLSIELACNTTPDVH